MEYYRYPHAYTTYYILHTHMHTHTEHTYAQHIHIHRTAKQITSPVDGSIILTLHQALYVFQTFKIKVR